MRRLVFATAFAVCAVAGAQFVEVYLQVPVGTTEQCPDAGDPPDSTKSVLLLQSETVAISVCAGTTQRLTGGNLRGCIFNNRSLKWERSPIIDAPIADAGAQCEQVNILSLGRTAETLRYVPDGLTFTDAGTDGGPSPTIQYNLYRNTVH